MDTDVAVTRFIAEANILPFAADFRASLLMLQVDPHTPKGYAVAAVCTLMGRAGFDLNHRFVVMKYLCDRSDEQLREASSVVFVENGDILGVPSGDGALLFALEDLRRVEAEQRPPRVTLVVYYTQHYYQVAEEVFATMAESDGEEAVRTP